MSSLNDSTLNTLDLLDAKLEDLADLPEWVTFPAGVYKCKPSVKIEKKLNTKSKAMETIITIGAKLIEIKELNDPASVKVAVDSETSCRFTWENEFGQGGLKKLLAPIAALTKISSVKQLLDILGSADDVLFAMDTRDVTNSSNKTATYQVFTDLIVS
jgi:hypothetical protein